MTTTVSGIVNPAEQSARTVRGHEKAVATSVAAPILADNDIVVFAEIPVEANITSIRHWSDDLGTTGTLNVGFYPGNVAASGLTDADAVDEDAIATAVDVNAAALADVEIRFEVKDINTLGQQAWELAGLASRPDYDFFYVAYTAAAATTAAGDISAVIRYID